MDEKLTGKVAATVIPKTSSERKYLIAKRKDNGDWEFPGGKQEEGETLLETAEREMREEFGIEITGLQFNQDYSWRGGGYTIVPVLADHNYRNLDEILMDENIVDHEKYEWIKPEKFGEKIKYSEEKLGEELKALKAFGLV